jgi:isochorismate hydrolase
MKERYFTPQSISEKSQEIFQSFDQTRRRSRLERFNPQRSALLVLDMQEYFLHPSSHACVPSASAIIPGLQSLVNAYTARELLIVFTRHLNTAHDAGSMASWWRDLITEENLLSVITPAIDSTNGVTLIKTQYDAFYNTALEALLRDRQVTQVVISGVMTHLCCETTARSAFVRGFDAFFTIDGTATYTEAHHQATLLNLAHGFATPVLVTEILAACQRGNDENA